MPCESPGIRTAQPYFGCGVYHPRHRAEESCFKKWTKEEPVMECILCGNDSWEIVFEYDSPDKYESWVGITDVKRAWKRCDGCGFYQHERNYPLSNLDVIYENGYRDRGLNGESIEESFSRISRIPESENAKRVEWVIRNGVPDTLLDIGSGIGIFPYVMKENGASVWCNEINSDSIRFINSLGIKCTKALPFHTDFSLVSLIHVLEHMEEPKEFLTHIKPLVRPKGSLYVEVPSASEFYTLDKYHDAFNSCHTVFFDLSTLEKTLHSCGYRVHDISELHYPQRNRTRVVAIGVKRTPRVPASGRREHQPLPNQGPQPVVQRHLRTLL